MPWAHPHPPDGTSQALETLRNKDLDTHLHAFLFPLDAHARGKYQHASPAQAFTRGFATSSTSSVLFQRVACCTHVNDIIQNLQKASEEVIHFGTKS